MLVEADAAARSGDLKKAADVFGAIAADVNVPKEYRDLALVRQTAIQFDSLKPSEVIARLKPLAIAGNPWFPSASELTAIAYLNDNQPDLAWTLFAAIARDRESPPPSRAPATQIPPALRTPNPHAPQPD